ncbi:MAG: hypothetical protein CL912_22665 [Deltaproteobacteria bacterium]|nr:hypothetical protein [Deltaproteobacteria bacterium]
MKPLTFWLQNKEKYPVLSLIARNFLQIPATSAPSERVFSQGALIINKLRNRLAKDTFEKIICLKSWGVIKEEEEEDDIREEVINIENNNLFFIE